MIIADEISQYIGLDHWWINKLILQSYNWIYRVCVARILVLAVWFLREIMSGK